MSLFKKITTAIRGGAREAGEAIVDANSTRIFEQEIKDAEKHLAKAKQDLTGVMANKMSTGRELERVKKEIEKHEGYATQALNKGEEALALEVAEKIAHMEVELTEHQQAYDNFEQSIARLKNLIKKTERQLVDYQRRLTMVKTTESVHKATATITDNFSQSNSSLLNAKSSLERIQKRQQEFEDKLKAGEELEAEMSDKSLEDKLANAGIVETGNKANDVLARLRSKQ